MGDNKKLENMYKIISLIHEERERQDKIWGFPQNNTIAEWGLILGEEYGEVIREMNDLTFLFDNLNRGKAIQKRLKEELIQLAAVAISILEHLDMHDYSELMTFYRRAESDENSNS